MYAYRCSSYERYAHCSNNGYDKKAALCSCTVSEMFCEIAMCWPKFVSSPTVSRAPVGSSSLGAVQAEGPTHSLIRLWSGTLFLGVATRTQIVASAPLLPRWTGACQISE